MTLRYKSLPLQSHVGPLTISSTTTTPRPTSSNVTTCYPYLSARLAKGQLHLSLSDISQLICVFASDLPEIKSTELSYYDLFRKHLSLSPVCPLLSLYPSVFLSLLPARCTHLWRHHLIFPPFRQKHPKIDRKVSSGDQARGFSASQSMS